MSQSAVWTLVLAGGEGSRLRKLTTTASGEFVPKQYCSLWGGQTLIQDAIRRAFSISFTQHICAIVADQHRSWWQGALSPIQPDNVVVQPHNRGTGNGILLALLHILDHDPDAELVILPCDHYFEDEAALREAIARALAALPRNPDNIMVLGVEPDQADPELGYIVPDAGTHEPQAVAQFVEKPGRELARELMRDGALWSSFILVVRAKTLLNTFAEARRKDVLQMQLARRSDAASLEAFYLTLRELDFSKHILQQCADRLRIIRVRPCGWNDLGTPGRIFQTLSKAVAKPFGGDGAALNLALKYTDQFRAVMNVVSEYSVNTA